MQVERATIADVPAIHRMVSYFAAQGDLLPRSLSELYENVRDFFVLRNEHGEVIACAALHVVWSNLAELKAVAVAEEWQSHGLGASIVGACLEEAQRLDIATVFCLTHKPEFYARYGFSQSDVMTLPRKVWGECVRCPKFANCNEIAMVVQIRPEMEGETATLEQSTRQEWGAARWERAVSHHPDATA